MLRDQLPRPRNERKDPGPFGGWIDSWMLSLRADGKAEKTRKTYRDAAVLLAGWLLDQGLDDWAAVDKDRLRLFWIWLEEAGYAKSSRNQFGRSLQQFFRWYCEEEDVPNPFVKVKPPPAPRPGEKLVPIISDEDLATLIKDAEKGRDFESRRDAAILHLFRCTGVRLAELAGLGKEDPDLARREAAVTGKGGKQRVVKFDHACALALDRYLRLRSKHRAASIPSLWIGTRRRTGMTPNGVYQMIERRARRLGMKIHPHMFRHTFSHRWLDAGGAEGDLMELNGWESAQMLRHYGRSARSARARRAYDRVMGDQG